MVLLTMLILPTLVAIGFLVFGGKKVTLKEFLTQIAVQTVLMACVAYGVSCQNTADTELLNGRISKKAREIVSCEHSYSCNCYESCSGSGSSRSCTTICQTCYEHSYDVDWAVYLNIGERMTISRVDRQGLSKPRRWEDVVVGEPATVTHGFTNYIKGSPDTLFRHQGLVEKYEKDIPSYPGEVYDYYRVRRLVSQVALPDSEAWNKDLAEVNADLGPTKQADVAVVVLSQKPREFYSALEEKWIGGKKNDVVLVIDLDSNGVIDWVEVMAWTDNKIFQVELRDEVYGSGVQHLNRESIIKSIKFYVQRDYVRKHMKDFEYLKGLIRPTTGQWIFAMLLGLIVSVGLGVYFYNEDPFDDDVYQPSFPRFRR